MNIQENITGIQHIGIPTNDIEKTIRFYEGLGFDTVYRTVIEPAGIQVAFQKIKNLIIETYQNNAAAMKSGAINHIALDVDDIDTVFAKIKDGNYKMIDSEIQSLPFWEHGVKYFNIEGPNGEIIEFSQML